LLFNNQIYGLTKGQYSPTSELNKNTKSTPMGSIDNPVNPLNFAMGANGSFIARSMDRDPKHLKVMLKRSNAHKGASFLEIYQNCNIFNDGAFFAFTDKATKSDTAIFLEQGEPLVFGAEASKGVALDGYKPKVINLANGEMSKEDLWIHDESDLFKAQMLTHFFDDPQTIEENYLPRPFGVLYENNRPTYEDLHRAQIEQAVKQKGDGDLNALIRGSSVWEIE